MIHSIVVHKNYASAKYSLAGFVEAQFGGYQAVAGSNFLEHGMQRLRAAL